MKAKKSKRMPFAAPGRAPKAPPGPALDAPPGPALDAPPTGMINPGSSTVPAYAKGGWAMKSASAMYGRAHPKGKC